MAWLWFQTSPTPAWSPARAGENPWFGSPLSAWPCSSLSFCSQSWRFSLTDTAKGLCFWFCLRLDKAQTVLKLHHPSEIPGLLLGEHSLFSLLLVNPQTFPSCPLSTLETCTVYSVRMAWAQEISPWGDKGTCQLPNKPEEHPLEKKQKSYVCLLSLFSSSAGTHPYRKETSHLTGLVSRKPVIFPMLLQPLFHHIHPTIPPWQEQPTSYQSIEELLRFAVPSASGLEDSHRLVS